MAHSASPSRKRKSAPTVFTILMLAAAALTLIPVATVHTAVTSQPQLGVLNSVPTPSGSAYLASATISVIQGTNNATTDTAHSGLFTIFFSCTGCTTVTMSGASFYIYLSKDGFASLSTGDVRYAGPFLTSNFTNNQGTLGRVSETTGHGNGTYYIGTTGTFAGCSSGCEVVEGPLPVHIAAGYAYVKVYDGSAIAAVQTFGIISVTTTSSTTTSSTVTSSTATSTTSSHSSSTSTSTTHSTTLPRTTTSVTCTPSPATVGEIASCTATVTGHLPTGMVSWSAGRTGSTVVTFSSACFLTAGSCSVPFVPDSAQSSFWVNATYGGDSSNGASVGQRLLAVDKVATSVSVSCFPATLPIGSLGLCTAIVTGYHPTGTLEWTGDAAIGFYNAACTLSSTVCTTAVAGSTASLLSLTATYMGDANNEGSSGMSYFTSVSPPTTSTTSSVQASSSVSPTTTAQESSIESTTSTSSTGSGIPEFPPQVGAVAALAAVVLASYMAIGRRMPRR